MTHAATADDPHALRLLIEARLRDTSPQLDLSLALPGGFAAELTPELRRIFPDTLIPAAVLVPIIAREEGLTVLLTQRAAHLARHASQISFPGGRIEAGDSGPLEAALRETEEEIGLQREYVSVAGYLPPHLVISGYWITPVVGLVRSGFTLKLDPREVEGTFEAPLAHVFNPRNHQTRERTLGEAKMLVHDIPYGPHQIWGATAGILIALHRLLTQ